MALQLNLPQLSAFESGFERLRCRSLSDSHVACTSVELDDGSCDLHAVVRHTFWELREPSSPDASAPRWSDCCRDDEEDSTVEASSSRAAETESDSDVEVLSQDDCSVASSQSAAPTAPAIFYVMPWQAAPEPAKASAGPGRAERTKPRHSSGSAPPAATPEPVAQTTLLLKNLPPSCTTEALAQWLTEEGFGESYDFVYVPLDMKESRAFGYGFVNCVSEGLAAQVKDWLAGCPALGQSDAADISIEWGSNQGLAAQIERYRNSQIMHKSVPAHFKPMLFSAGVRQPFPAPTKPIVLNSISKSAKPAAPARRNKGQDSRRR